MKSKTNYLLTALAVFAVVSAQCQKYDPSKIFAHNDYERAVPFYTAYDLRVGYIEADVFLIENNALAVAHSDDEIKAGKTLKNLYLEPLAQKVAQNHGSAYPGSTRVLTLMIDLKTQGVPTLKAIVDQLGSYPQLTACTTLNFMISGNVPDPATWGEYPPFITFDGRPGIDYTPSQLARIRMISTSFTQHITWNGRDKISKEARNKISALVDQAHTVNKPFRFWATPDFEQAWKALLPLQLDVIGTDNVEAFARFLKQQE